MIEPSDIAGEVYRALTEQLDTSRTGPAALSALAAWRAVQREADTQLTAWAIRARQRGMSWQAIGHELGISKQAAQQRYGGV